MEGAQRPILTDDERDDAKQVLALAIAGIQRERGAADQYYVRGRNLLGFAAALFTAVQAAFVASIGRESANKVLLSESERDGILWPAGLGAVFLVVALALLLFWLDRPRQMNVVGAETLIHAWLDPNGKHRGEGVLEVLASRAIQEEKEWAESNGDRKSALKCVGLACGLVGLAGLAELAMLYLSLT